MKKADNRITKFPSHTKNVKEDLDFMAYTIVTNFEVPMIKYLIDKVVQMTNEKALGEHDGK